MPAVVVAGAVYGGAAALGVITWGTAALAIGATAFSYVVSEATRPKIKAPSSRDPETTQLVRNPVSAYRLIYGETQVSGTLVFAHVTKQDDIKYLHLVIVLSGREITSIGETYLNDLPLSTTDRYSRQIIDTVGVNNGKFYFTKLIFDTDKDKKVRVGDTIVAAGFINPGNNGTFKVTAVTFNEIDEGSGFVLYVVVSVDSVLTDESRTIGKSLSRSLVRISKYVGTATQLADPDLVSEVDLWTVNHRLRGRAYAYVRLTQDFDAFPTGIPNIKFDVQGHAVYDPRTTLTAYSDNPALCALDYIRYKYGINSADADIDFPSWIAAANACDELVNISPTEQQARYTCNGTYDLDSEPVEILDMLRSSMGGAIVWALGSWRGYAGVASASIGSIGLSDFRSGISYRNKPGRDERFNSVSGTFRDPADYGQSTDFPQVVNSLYESEDGGEQLTKDIDLPFCNDPWEAQRVAKVMLEDHRQGLTATLPLKLGSGLDYLGQVWGVVSVTVPYLGWSNKLFRILQAEIAVDGESMLGVNLLVKEYADGIYDWNYGEATKHDIAPNTELPSPFDVAAPTGLVLTSGTNQLLIQADGTIVSRIRLDWDDPLDYGVVRTEIQYRKEGDSLYTDSTSALSGETGEWIAPVEDGKLYDVRIRHVNSFNVTSDWLQVDGHFVVGKSAAPSDVFNFLVQREPDGTRIFTWDEVPDLDLAGYLIKYRLGQGWLWDDLSALHAGLITVNPWETNQLAAGDYTIGIKAVDTTGNESINARMIYTTLGDPRIKNAIFYVSAHIYGWPGTKTNCDLDEGSGYLTSLGNYAWDNLTTWDAWLAWSDPSFTTIIYQHTDIDLGASVPFLPLITATASNTPVIEINYSTDGIVWSGWAAVTGQIVARFLQVRVTVNKSTTEIPQLFTLTIIASGDVIEEEITDSNTATWAGSAATGRVVPITNSYSTIVSIQLALQSVGGGWTWEIINKNPASPTIKIYNASNVASDAVVDCLVKGLPSV